MYIKLINKFRSTVNSVKTKIYILLRRGHKIINPRSIDLEKHGFINFDNISIDKLILDNFLRLQKTGYSDIDFLPLINNELNQNFQFYALPLNNLFILNKIFTDDLYLILKDFFGKDFYLNSNIQFAIYNADTFNGTEDFHIDSNFSVNLMINLTAVSKETVHMEFIDAEAIFDPKNTEEVEMAQKFYTFGIPGSSFLFTAGRNFHKRVLGKMRAVLILNFVPIKGANLIHTYSKKNERNEFNLRQTRSNDDFEKFIKMSKYFTKDNFIIYK